MLFDHQEKSSPSQNNAAIERLVCDLCKSLIKDSNPAKLEETKVQAFRLLANLNESRQFSKDETGVVENIKQKLHSGGKTKDLYKVGELHAKLQQNASLQNRKSVLQFLLSMANNQTKKATGFSLSYGARTSTPAPVLISGNHSSLPNSLKTASTLSSVPYGSTHKDPSLFSSHNLASYSKSSNNTPAENLTTGLLSDRIASSSLPGYPQASKPHIISRNKMLGDSKKINETELIRQVLFVFQGIETKDIKLNHKYNAFHLLPEVNIDGKEKQLVHRLCELGWLYLRINEFVKKRRADRTYGSVGQAFCAALEQEITEYYRLVAVLQSQLHVATSPPDANSDGRSLTLHKLVVWTSEPLERLKWIASLVDNCKGKRGGALLSAIYSFVRTGDSEAKCITRRIMKIVSQPILRVIDKWIYNGELHDPYQEFFVTSDPNIGVEHLWFERYKMHNSMIPSFLPLEQANKILLVGKSINYLRLVCNDRSQILEVKPQQQQNLDVSDIFDDEMNFANDLMPRIDKAYKATSAHLLSVLNSRYKLNTHLHALRKYFLLGQGDFIRHLLDNLQDELKKPADKIFRHNIQAHVEAAKRASNAQFEDDDVLSRLDFRILQRNKGDSGWNVFSLDYHVDPPINTLITPEVINEYLQIFMFLWRAKRVRHHLSEVWMNSMEYTRKLSPCIPELKGVLHKCHLLTAEMWNFVHQFHYYIAFEVLECSWADLQKTLDEAKDFDCVITAHHNFLETLLKRCLLDQTSSTLWRGLRSIFDQILKFQVLHEEMFGQSLAELKLRQKFDKIQEEKEAKGVWGFDQKAQEEEQQRRRNFVKKTILQMRSQLQLCSNAYQDMVIDFLHKLTQATDTNLRNLSWRLDFNETYKRRTELTRK